MKEQLLDLLCEPGTGAELTLCAPTYRDGEIWEGTLRSRVSGREYPIRGGIPRFVPASNYSDSFGLQWNRFSQVQLDSANGVPYSKRRFDAELGWTAAEIRGKWILDGGCGCGRFAEIAAQYGGNVIALDYSSAVDAAARNLRGFRNVHFVQGNLLEPPLRRGAIDVAYSIGVLQHTPDPPRALSEILELLAPGGLFGFTIYARRWYTRFNAKYAVRHLTRHLRAETVLRLVEGSMPVVFPITEVLFSIPVARGLFRWLIPVANYVEKTEFTREQRYDEAVLDTFDMLSPSFDRPMTADEVRQVFREHGVGESTFRSTVPIVVVGSKGLRPGAGLSREPQVVAQR